MSAFLAPSRLATRSLQPGMALRPAYAAAIHSTAVAKAPQTQHLTPAENLTLLNQHRSVRPISPHLTIYRYPLNMHMSIMTRITGAGLSAGMYAGALAYVALPLVGVQESSIVPQLVDFVSHLPMWATLSAKTILAVPFAYHSINGCRHLVWDSGRILTNSATQKSGVVVLTLTALSSIGLVGWGTFW